MEEQQPAPALQIYDSHRAINEDLALDIAAQASLDSPSSTIPFDDDYTLSRQLRIERFFSGEEATGAEALRCPVIEISDDEEDSQTPLSRPRRRTTRHPDYSYQDYQDTMDHTISASSLGRRRREDSNAPRFPSKVKQLVNEIQGQYEALEKEHEQSVQQRHRWMKERHQRQKEREQWKKEKDKWKKKERQLQFQIRYLQRHIDEQKQRNILKCAVCHRTFSESWKCLGCGHSLCNDCVEEIDSTGSLFKSVCPYAHCKKPIRSCFDFYPNVVEA